MNLHLLCIVVALIAFLCVPATGDDSFDVEFAIAGGSKFVARFYRGWAPIGIDHFKDLVADKFFDEAAIFRYVPSFVAQFGIAGSPVENAKWNTTILKDDPVSQSNTAGRISYATAGPNTRTTQLFINMQDNSFLDGQGFAPIGEVISGLDVVLGFINPTPGDSGGIDQNEYMTKGNDWLMQNYKASFIESAALSQRTTATDAGLDTEGHRHRQHVARHKSNDNNKVQFISVDVKNERT